MRISACIVLAASLAGCVTAQEQQQQFDAAAQQCIQTTKKMFARMRCAINAENQIAGRETPLMAYKHAEMLRIGVQFDKGQISKEEATAELAMVDARVRMKEAGIQEAQIQEASTR